MENNEKTADAIGGGVFLIGLGILFLSEIDFWPGILLVIAALGFANNLVKGLWTDAVISVIVLGGLALWFGGVVEGDLLLPIGLIAVGVVMMLNVFRRTDYGKRKNEDMNFVEGEEGRY